MKAAVLYANRDLRYDDYPDPELKAHTVKIHVKAAGICGSDVPRVLNNGAHFYPVVLGHEFSGEVAEVGEGVTDCKAGDRVTAAPLLPCMKCADCELGHFSLCKNYSFIGSREQGAFAEYIVVPEKNIVKFSPSVSYEQGAMFEPATVSLHGVFCNDYTGGHTVAVIGCGTIGIFAIQWARIFGASHITAFDIDKSRLDLAGRMGADQTVNTLSEDWKKKTADLTNGRGYDYVFEASGSPATVHMSMEVAGNRSHLCYIGTPRGDLQFTRQEWELLNRREMKLTGSWMSYSAPFPGREWSLTAHYFGTGELRFDPAFIYRKYPLSKAAEAFSLFDHPEQVHGKIMLMNEEA
jgi:L-iditol 2-dehydrogenase